MKKYLIGGVIGFLVAPLVGLLYLYIQLGSMTSFWLDDRSAEINTDFDNLQDDTDYYRQPAENYLTRYRMIAPFMDETSEWISYRNLGFYHLDPVINFQKEDYRSVCIQSFDADKMDLAVTLNDEARGKLIESFSQNSDTSYYHPLDSNDFRKRYVIEAKGGLLISLLISGSGAQTYKNAVEAAPNEPDFVLSVHFTQLENLQYYLTEGMTDTPPEGCTPEVNPSEIPGWKTVVLPYWKKWEEQQREENDSSN